MPRTKNQAPEKRTAIKRGLAMVYYKDGRVVKQNSGGHYEWLLKVVKRKLEAKTYGADAVKIMTHSSGRVRAAFVLKNGKAVPMTETAPLPVPKPNGKVPEDLKQVLTVEAVKAGGARFRMGRFLIDITIAE